jgi:peptidoglycan/xylan/chitin deacetylase (PgdA/CDA1 family)
MTNISPDGAIRVAVTVDDFVLWDGLPMPAGVTPLGITKSMAATLTEHGVSGVYGFAHTHRLDLDPSLMAAWEAWVEAGHHLGNHTHLHAPLRWMSAAQYCADIDKAEKLIGNLIELAPERYFRYAMDMAGETEAKRGQVEDHLRDCGYRNAPITAWFGDFAWIVPYYRAVVSGDEAAQQMLRETYVSSAVGQLAAHAQLARRLFGQDVPLIWLIHGTTIATDTLGTILDAFAEQGVEFIELREAMSHPVHFGMPPCNSEFLRNHLQRYAIAAGIPEPHLDPALFGQVITAAPVEGYDTVGVFEEKMLKPLAQRAGATYDWTW